MKIMILKLIDSQLFKAGDNTSLREVLHPKNLPINLPYSLAYAFLEPDETSLLHSLKETEVYFIISGNGIIKIGAEESEFAKGDCLLVPPDTPQSIINTGRERLEFICIVSPSWTEEGETIL